MSTESRTDVTATVVSAAKAWTPPLCWSSQQNQLGIRVTKLPSERSARQHNLQAIAQPLLVLLYPVLHDFRAVTNSTEVRIDFLDHRSRSVP